MQWKQQPQWSSSAPSAALSSTRFCMDWKAWRPLLGSPTMAVKTRGDSRLQAESTFPNLASLYVRAGLGACFTLQLGLGHSFYLDMPRHETARNELYVQLLRRMTESGDYDK